MSPSSVSSISSAPTSVMFPELYLVLLKQSLTDLEVAKYTRLLSRCSRDLSVFASPSLGVTNIHYHICFDCRFVLFLCRDQTCVFVPMRNSLCSLTRLPFLCVSILLFLFTLLFCGTKHMASLFLSWAEMSKLDLWTPTSILAFTATCGPVLCPSFATSNNLQMQEITSYSAEKSSVGWIWSAGYSLPMHILGNPEALSEMCARMLLVSQFSSLLWLCSLLVTGCLRVVPRTYIPVMQWCEMVFSAEGLCVSLWGVDITN